MAKFNAEPVGSRHSGQKAMARREGVTRAPSNGSVPTAVSFHMDRLVGHDVALDGIEKTNEFDMTVALHAAADHGAVEHAERGKQRCGA